MIKLHKTTPAVRFFCFCLDFNWNLFSTLDSICSMQLSIYGEGGGDTELCKKQERIDV